MPFTGLTDYHFIPLIKYGDICSKQVIILSSFFFKLTIIFIFEKMGNKIVNFHNFYI